MKREAWQHSKLRLLARDLGISLCHARGIMESLWILCQINFPAGDIGRMTDEEIGIGIDYDGDYGKLIQVLQNRRLIEEIPMSDGRLYIHDWHEHVDEGTHSRLARSGKLFANGSTPNFTKLSEKDRLKAAEHYRKIESTAQESAARRGTAQNGAEMRGAAQKSAEALPCQSLALPEPCPAMPVKTLIPVPGVQAPEVQPSASGSDLLSGDGKAFLRSIGWEPAGWKGIRKATADQVEKIQNLREADLTENSSLDSLFMIWARIQWFEEFWLGYWRKVDKKSARIAYLESVTTLALHDRLVAAAEAQSPEMLSTPEKKQPHAATWIHKERWYDVVSNPECA